jgi:predicted GNAT family acetyltransferase
MTDAASFDENEPDDTSERSGATSDAVTIARVDAAGRYELSVDGRLAGVCTYRDAGDTRVLLHTVIFDGYEGHGLGTRLIEFALADIRAAGLRLVPQCPMVALHIDRHPEWADLVDGAHD